MKRVNLNLFGSCLILLVLVKSTLGQVGKIPSTSYPLLYEMISQNYLAWSINNTLKNQASVIESGVAGRIDYQWNVLDSNEYIPMKFDVLSSINLRDRDYLLIKVSNLSRRHIRNYLHGFDQGPNYAMRLTNDDNDVGLIAYNSNKQHSILFLSGPFF